MYLYYLDYYIREHILLTIIFSGPLDAEYIYILHIIVSILSIYL